MEISNVQNENIIAEWFVVEKLVAMFVKQVWALCYIISLSSGDEYW